MSDSEDLDGTLQSVRDRHERRLEWMKRTREELAVLRRSMTSREEQPSWWWRAFGRAYASERAEQALERAFEQQQRAESLAMRLELERQVLDADQHTVRALRSTARSHAEALLERVGGAGLAAYRSALEITALGLDSATEPCWELLASARALRALADEVVSELEPALGADRETRQVRLEAAIQTVDHRVSRLVRTEASRGVWRTDGIDELAHAFQLVEPRDPRALAAEQELAALLTPAGPARMPRLA